MGKCSDCGEEKPIVSEEYHKDGFSARCSECFDKSEQKRIIGGVEKPKEDKPKKDSIKGKFKKTVELDD